MSAPQPPDHSGPASQPTASVRLVMEGELPLPRPSTQLVGRDAEVAAIASLMREPNVRLVTLTGPGGVGKTRLAIAAAARVTSGYADGVVFVDLSSVLSPSFVLSTIASSLGLRDNGIESPHDRLVAAIAEQRLLLVLDNFEQVVDAAPELITILHACPDITILVTSRIRLRISGEREFPVTPLSVDTGVHGDAARPTSAIQLFVERVRDIQPDFKIGLESGTAIAEIVRRVDGLPLAIELAAARVRVLPPTALLQRMEMRLPLLSRGARDLPLRQQTMRDTIRWSYELLSESEQTLFRRLGIFVGGFTLDAAEEIGVGSSIPSAGLQPAMTVDVLDGIIALVEHNLLRQGETSNGEPRYQMLETVREFGLECMGASGEEEAIRRGHAAYFAQLAEQAEPELTGPRQLTWFDQLEAEYANMRSALAWAIQHDKETGLKIAGALIRFWDHHSHVREGRRWLEAVLAGDDTSHAALRAKALWGVGVLAIGSGDYPRAEAALRESVALARAANDRYVIGFALNALGSVALHHGDLDHAAALHAEGLGYLREIGDRDGMAALLGNLAYGALVRGDPEQAVAPADESLELYRALGSAHGTANMLGTLGRALLERGDLDRARNLLSEGLLLGREIGNTWYITLALEGLAAVDAAQGRRDHAVRIFAAVEALIEASGVSVHPFQDEGVHLPALRERRLTNLKTTMGAVAFADAWEAGRELSLEQVITDALVTVDPVESAGSVSVSAGSTATFGLTLRELEVLRLLTEGLSDREIADALSISVRTAGNHVQHTMQKLGVESRTAAAVFAVRHDLV